MMLLTCCIFALLSSSIIAKTAVSLSGIHDEACDTNETLCGSRCCPFPDAVCCPETQSCCQQGNVCLGSIPYCLGLKSEGTPALYSRKSTALKESDCPSGTTTCAGGCCPLPDAVCCPDGVTCCPSGYVCGPIGSGVCERGVDVVARFLKAILTRFIQAPSTDTSNNYISRRPYYGPTAGDNCCEAWFGYICCQFPSVCTTLGCM